MLEMICAIPEEIGLVLVGMLGILCGIGLYQLVKMWKERHENNEECEE